MTFIGEYSILDGKPILGWSTWRDENYIPPRGNIVKPW